jgi:hypothetical protein
MHIIRAERTAPRVQSPRLEEAILAAEQAVLSRDIRVRDGLRRLDRQVHLRLERLRRYGRWTAIAGAALAAGIATWHGRPHPPAGPSQPTAPPQGTASLSRRLRRGLGAVLGTLASSALAAWAAGQHWLPPGALTLLLHAVGRRRGTAGTPPAAPR